ncbi:MAG: hypothetical protein V4583_13410, partial [Pseudomonadota bacterium]
MAFQLAACAEMLWRDKPIHWRAARLHEMGFGVGLWNWPEWDLDALEKTGATFTIMNGYMQGRLADAEGAEMLLASAKQTAQVGKRLGVVVIIIAVVMIGTIFAVEDVRGFAGFFQVMILGVALAV